MNVGPLFPPRFTFSGSGSIFLTTALMSFAILDKSLALVDSNLSDVIFLSARRSLPRAFFDIRSLAARIT